MRKKIVKRRALIGFTKEAAKALADKKKITGKDQTKIINDLLTGEEKFGPLVEELIARRQKEKKLSRNAAIESLLVEAAMLLKRI